MVQIIEPKHLDTHPLASTKQEEGPKLKRILNCLFFFEKKKKGFWDKEERNLQKKASFSQAYAHLLMMSKLSR